MTGQASCRITRRHLVRVAAAATVSMALDGGAHATVRSASFDEELAWKPAWALREMFRHRRLSATEYAQFLLARIERHRDLGAFLTIDGDYLMAQARRADKVHSRDQPLLHGLPVSVKDLLYTRGLRTTLGSRLFANFVPDNDAVAVERVRAAGGIVFAKSNTPEFGLTPRTMNLLGPETRNPWDLTRTSGGSSGGAACATAAGLGPLAVATDGGGSIRLPAAFNGVFGLKTSRGLIPNGYGPYANPNSVIGPITRDVRDAAMLLQVMEGYDARDHFAVTRPRVDYLSALDDGVRGVRMAWSEDLGRVPAHEADVVALCHDAARQFARLGAVYSEPSIKIENPMDPMVRQHDFSNADVEKRMRAIYPDYVDNTNWIAHLSAEQRTQLTDYVRNLGKYVDFAIYLKTITPEVRNRATDRLSDLFGRYDLLLTPTINQRAFVIGGEEPSPLQYTAYTVIFNNSGHCAASVPAGFVRNMPVGLQIIGRPGDEAQVLRAARALERARPWAGHCPDFERHG